MAGEVCSSCQASPELGEPSLARWVGPDGETYCSLHFIHKFGHSEPLVKIEGYEPPAKVKEPA